MDSRPLDTPWGIVAPTYDVGDLTLVGARTVLEPLTVQHVPALAAAAAEGREHFGMNPVPDGEDEAAAYVDRALRERRRCERLAFAVRWRDRVVGTTSYWELRPWAWPPGHPLQRHDRPDAVEIGSTWYAASAIRTSCNTEAKLLLLRHAFETWEVHRVCFKTDARNERSRRAIERIGATFEGIRRAHVPAADGTVRDSAYFSIVAAEWPGVRDLLGRLLDR